MEVGSALPDQVAAWVRMVMGPGAHIEWIRPLPGGTQAAMHLIGLALPQRRLDVVLRRYRADERSFATREVLALRALAGLDGLVPQVLGADVEGAPEDRPTLLLSRLPGTPVLSPAEVDSWAGRLAVALARIHGVPAAALTPLPDLLAELAPTLGAGISPPLATGWHLLGRQPRILVHGDYWTGNVLWQADRVTGVVDWANAALAPRGVDVGNGRLDLALMFSREVADHFLSAYQQAAGERVPHLALWDLFIGVRAKAEGWLNSWVGGYRALGRGDLDRPTLEARLDRWIADAAERVGS